MKFLKIFCEQVFFLLEFYLQKIDKKMDFMKRKMINNDTLKLIYFSMNLNLKKSLLSVFTLIMVN